MQSCSNEFLSHARMAEHKNLFRKDAKGLESRCSIRSVSVYMPLHATENPIKHFKPIDVQQSNLADVLLQPFVADALIYAPDQPVEQAGIDHFGHGVARKRS